MDKCLEKAKEWILFKYDKYLSGTCHQKFLVTGLTKYLKDPYRYGMPMIHKTINISTEPEY